MTDVMKCQGCNQSITSKWIKPTGATGKWHPECWEKEQGSSGTAPVSSVPVTDDAKGEGIRPVKKTAFERLTQGMGETTSSTDYESPAPKNPVFASAAPVAPPKATSTDGFCKECGAKRSGGTFCAECGAK
eukprot:TRINITY_DN2599_c0_g1_i6.p1 TRINITY_DN2599_c0_g1~~TRINITY_DN2599_c0_g1_i6.p1  ORF type:complete len:131 (-),score=16.48 TRINITY_DN2599_c0_g1_i6:166-558(-)